MRVKFTNPEVHEVLFGSIIEMSTPESFAILADNGERYIINPNSDYNFRFSLNEEGERIHTQRWNEMCDKLEAADRK